MHRQLLTPFLIAILSFVGLNCFSQARQKFDTGMDSVFYKNTNIYYDKETGEEHREVMSRDVIVLKDKGRVQESYQYNDRPQPHVGLVKEPAKSILSYDKEGRLITYFAFFTNGEPRTKDFYTYAASGLTGEVNAFYVPENKLSNTCKLTLDHNFNIIKTENYTTGLDSPLVIKYIYNKKNQIIQEEWHTAGSPATTLYFHNYDGNQNLIEDKMILKWDGKPDKIKISTYSYEGYDSHNNWLVRNTLVEGKLRGKMERRITYHK